jgi:uncharacterized protein YciI
MPRYYFHVVTPSGPIQDEEGSDLPSLAIARKEAVKDARALMSSSILAGYDISARRMEIWDETGLLLVVPFSEAIRPER